MGNYHYEEDVHAARCTLLLCGHPMHLYFKATWTWVAVNSSGGFRLSLAIHDGLGSETVLLFDAFCCLILDGSTTVGVALFYGSEMWLSL